MEDKLTRLYRLAADILNSKIDHTYFGEPVTNSQFALLAHIRPKSGDLGRILEQVKSKSSQTPLLVETEEEKRSEDNTGLNYTITNQLAAVRVIIQYVRGEDYMPQPNIANHFAFIEAHMKNDSGYTAIRSAREATFDILNKLYKGHEPWIDAERLFHSLKKYAGMAESIANGMYIDFDAIPPTKEDFVTAMVRGQTIDSLEVCETLRSTLEHAMSAQKAIFKGDNAEPADFAARAQIYEQSYDQAVESFSRIRMNATDMMIFSRCAASISERLKQVLTEVGRPPKMEGPAQD
jgi:hypothetical protein